MILLGTNFFLLLQTFLLRDVFSSFRNRKCFWWSLFGVSAFFFYYFCLHSFVETVPCFYHWDHQLKVTYMFKSWFFKGKTHCLDLHKNNCCEYSFQPPQLFVCLFLKVYCFMSRNMFYSKMTKIFLE